MKNIFFITILSIFSYHCYSQSCMDFDLDYGSTAIIPYCEEKLVTITLTNSCGSDDYFDVYVSSTSYTTPYIVDPIDFNILSNTNGFRIYKYNVYIPANGSIELQFTFGVIYSADFNITFLTKKASETIYYHHANIQFYPEEYVLLTGNLSDLISNNAPGLFTSANDACNPNNVRNYIVQGNFIVDVDYCFTGQRNPWDNGPGSNILINPGSSIQVSDNANLNITNMKIGTRNNTTCESQTGWVGFQVNSGSSLNILNSQINDAHCGINASSNTTIECTKTMFIDDYIGIFSNSSGTKSVVLSQCKFFPNEGFADAYSGQPTRIGTVPYAGISLTNANLVVSGGGTQFVGVEEFKSLRHGIIATNCNLTLSNSDFRSIGLENTSYGFTNSSNGLKMLGIFPKMASIMNCNFYNMQHGIRSMRMNTTIDNCNIGNLQTQNYDHIVGYGIIVENSNTAHTIKNCTLRTNQSGILLYHNYYGTAANVIKNNFFLTDQWDDAKGIWADMNTTSWEIHDNTFEPVKGLNAIRTNNCKEFNIHDNVIKYPTSLNLHHHAVKLIADEKMNVQCNAVSNGPSNSSLNLHAFDVSSSPSCNFVCNSSTTGERQMVFLENNMNSLIKGNTFAGSALYGLCVGDEQIHDAIVGEQPAPGSGDLDHGNKWTGSYNTYGAANFSSNYVIMGLSRFLVDEDESSQFLPTLPTGQLGSFFYDEYKESLSFSCSSLSSCASLHPRTRTLSDSDTNYVSMIDTSLEFEYYSDEQNWTSRYILYKLLKEGDFEAEENSVFEDFLADNANSEFGLLYNAEFLVRNSIGLKQTQWDTLINGIEDIALYQAQLDTLIPFWEVADSSIFDSLVEQMFVAYSEVDSLSDGISPNYDSITNHLISRAELMSALLDTLSCSETPAENLRIALWYMLKKVEDPFYEYDSTDLAELEAVAEMCALEGGIGTYLAQAILGAELRYVYDPYDNCSFSSSLIVGKENDDKNKIRVSPIPAQNILVIECTNTAEFERVYKIVDLLGLQHGIITIPAFQLAGQIDVSPLKSGIYLLFSENNSKEFAKFVKL